MKPEKNKGKRLRQNRTMKSVKTKIIFILYGNGSTKHLLLTDTYQHISQVHTRTHKHKHIRILQTEFIVQEKWRRRPIIMLILGLFSYKQNILSTIWTQIK